jgi:rod shape-determining protein MreD
VRFILLGMAVTASVMLQATWLPMLHLPGGVVPDLVLVLVICYALLNGPEKGFLFGAVAGFFVDIFSGGLIGLEMLTKTGAGYVAGLLEKKIFKESLFVPAVNVFAGTILVESAHLLLQMAFNSNYYLGWTLLLAVLPLAFYNALCAPVIHLFLLRIDSWEKRHRDRL